MEYIIIGAVIALLILATYKASVRLKEAIEHLDEETKS
jgi:hypothetical protein